MTKAVTPWAQLAEPFPDDEVRQRPGRGGMTYSYVTARAVMQRLDDVLTPEGWAFEVHHITESIAHGRLTIYVGDKAIPREDYGYRNGPDDEEPLKSAASDALKRCAVHIGVGRHLYTDDTHRPAQHQGTPTRGPEAVQGDGSWACPVHGTDKVRDKGKGQFCAGKMQDGSWCDHNERESQPVQPRPATAEPPNVAESFDDLSF